MTLRTLHFNNVVRANLSRWLGAAALTAGLFCGLIAPQGASAEIGGWRGDPIAHLSNGHIVKLTALVSASPADVLQVTYTVHTPAGASLTGVTFNHGDHPGKETVKVVDDNAPGTYDADTFVSTATAQAQVTAQTSVPGVGSDSASGTSGQDLLTHIAG